MLSYGGEVFLVGQALETLTNPNYSHHPDIADALCKLHRYKYEFAKPASNPRVTIPVSTAYLYAVETGNRDFVLPVYYVAPTK
jgi:hypothetical protein